MKQDHPMSIACSIGIMAYNEEANIGRMLEAVASQQTARVTITEIVVVASGCTDRTESIVQDWAKRDPRIRLLVQPRREGKASAINQFLPQAQEKIVVLCGGDLVPEADAIEELVAPFTDPAVGMTTGRPVPVNESGTFMGFAAHMLYDLFHEVNLRSFKILRIFLRYLDWRPRPFLWAWGVAALEAYGRFLGRRDYKQQRDQSVW